MNNPLNTAFKGWKMWLAIVFGLSVSGWMLLRSLSQVQFIECSPGTGTHSWVDANNNGIIDTHDSTEFKLAEDGSFRQQTIQDSLAGITWNSQSYFWIFAAFLFMVSRDFFYIVRIRILTKKQLNWRAATYVILLWEFASALSPGVVGGAAVAMFILNRETIPFGKATAIVIITAFMDNLFYVVMIPVVFLFISAQTLFPSGDAGTTFITWWFWGGFSIILFVCLLLYFTIFWYPKLATRFLLLVFSLPFIKRWKFIAAEWGKDIETASKEFKKETKSYWLKTFGATFLSWISRYLVINAILNAFLDLGFIDNIIVLGKQLVLWLFMLVSPTPGGSGIAEYAFGELLASFSSSMLLLSGLAILWRLISYFPYLFIGAFLLPSWIRRTQR